MAKTDWHHFDFGDYRIGVAPIEDEFALLFLVDDTAYPLARYPNESAAREALRVLDAAMNALSEFKGPPRDDAPKTKKPKKKDKKATKKKPGHKKSAGKKSAKKAKKNK